MPAEDVLHALGVRAPAGGGAEVYFGVRVLASTRVGARASYSDASRPLGRGPVEARARHLRRHEYEKCQYVEWLKRSKDEKVREEANAGHH